VCNDHVVGGHYHHRCLGNYRCDHVDVNDNVNDRASDDRASDDYDNDNDGWRKCERLPR